MFAMLNDDRALVGSLRPQRTLYRPRGRRGVSSVLAMMFVVIFGSLTAVMAIVAQGNLRTAHSGLQLSRAMSAAETGLVFAIRRLEDQGARFVVEKGVIEDGFAHALWLGTYDTSADGAVTILPPTTFTETIAATSIATAVFNAHVADSHSFAPEAGDDTLPQLDTINGTLRVQPIRLEEDNDQLYFRLRYELVQEVPAVRVISEGVDGQITRTLQLDFQITKKIKFAVLSPNRIMIGKNVRIDGPLGSRYGAPGPGQAQELAGANGHPLVMRSDYYFLSTDLDDQLDDFLAAVAEHDQDNDCRLRPDHADEGVAISDNPELVDLNGDEYVDEFDLFLGEFDVNTDGRVVYDAVLAAEVGMSGASEEFSDIDDQLARLVDEYNADRDGDGEAGTVTDRLLGYRDGVMDSKDLYAKLHGSLAFAVARDTWETAQSLTTYQEVVVGGIRPDAEDAAAEFEVPDEELREVTTEMFTSSSVWADDIATGDFAAQVAASGGTYTTPSDATWESVPYIPDGSPEAAQAGVYDYYQRPIYKDMTFTNVRIPKGTNALFEDCTFIGVTYIETRRECGHVYWNFAGARKRVETEPDSGVWTYPLVYDPAALDVEYGGNPIWDDTKVESNNLRFHNCTFLGSVHGDVPEAFTHYRNKLQYTGNTRFFIDPNDPALDEMPAAESEPIIDTLNGLGTEMLDELAKSSILMPGWSIDVGNFINEVDADPTLTPKVKLKGTIIAGILDVRGTADVFGTMLMTFRPETNVPPVLVAIDPAMNSQLDVFNTTIGYFGPDDGDGEGTDPDSGGFEGFGEITIRYNPDAKLPDGIPWPITVDPIAESYLEGGS